MKFLRRDRSVNGVLANGICNSGASIDDLAYGPKQSYILFRLAPGSTTAENIQVRG